MNTETKNIKDYLHLYLGCDVDTNITGQYVHPYGNISIKDLTVENFNLIYDQLDRKERLQKEGYNDSDHLYCKPILRPLYDMTEEESIYFYELRKGVEVYEKNIYDSHIEFNYRWLDEEIHPNTADGKCYSAVALTKDATKLSLTPEKTRWMLSKHFDLFNLISEGLAIDKTTLKHGQ